MFCGDCCYVLFMLSKPDRSWPQEVRTNLCKPCADKLIKWLSEVQVTSLIDVLRFMAPDSLRSLQEELRRMLPESLQATVPPCMGASALQGFSLPCTSEQALDVGGQLEQVDKHMADTRAHLSALVLHKQNLIEEIAERNNAASNRAEHIPGFSPTASDASTMSDSAFWSNRTSSVDTLKNRQPPPVIDLDVQSSASDEEPPMLYRDPLESQVSSPAGAGSSIVFAITDDNISVPDDWQSSEDDYLSCDETDGVDRLRASIREAMGLLEDGGPPFAAMAELRESVREAAQVLDAADSLEDLEDEQVMEVELPVIQMDDLDLDEPGQLPDHAELLQVAYNEAQALADAVNNDSQPQDLPDEGIPVIILD